MSHKLFPDDVNMALAVAGFLGSVVSSAFDWKGWVATARKVCVGSISALYLGPLVQPAISKIISGANAQALSGFIIGLCGLLIIEIIIEAIKLRSQGGSHETDA